jgi:hypothetical protein
MGDTKTRLRIYMDSPVSETYGQHESSAYGGHFGCTCHHPLFIFNQDGDVERAILRKGNVPWHELPPIAVASFTETAYVHIGDFLHDLLIQKKGDAGCQELSGNLL